MNQKKTEITREAKAFITPASLVMDRLRKERREDEERLLEDVAERIRVALTRVKAFPHSVPLPRGGISDALWERLKTLCTSAGWDVAMIDKEVCIKGPLPTPRPDPFPKARGRR